ncbi:MAG: response regulator transcription factor [Acidimicrobiales bacterium]
MAEVLVVDDDPDIRTLVAFALEDSGFAVRQAPHGAAALVAMEERAPDAIVLDVMMPALDGFGVLAARRQRSLAPQARVIILTCKTEERDYLLGWELGAHEYLTKPFDPELLVDKLHELMGVSLDVLHQRREAELQKARLLDRLAVAFTRNQA